MLTAAPRQRSPDGSQHTFLLLCNPGKREEFFELLLAALADTRAFEECESVETYVDQDNPDHIYLWEKWATRAHYEAYLAWWMETGMLDSIAPFMDPPPSRQFT